MNIIHTNQSSSFIAIVAKRLKILHVIHKTYYAVQCSTAGSGTGTTLVAMRRVAAEGTVVLVSVVVSRYQYRLVRA